MIMSAVFSGYKGPITPSARVHVFQLMTIRFDLYNFHYVFHYVFLLSA